MEEIQAHIARGAFKSKADGVKSGFIVYFLRAERVSLVICSFKISALSIRNIKPYRNQSSTKDPARKSLLHYPSLVASHVVYKMLP